ncbi:MAG: phage tail protein [Rhodoferax sp.]|uniref:phage tail protein n=1 Tax=Rhodoferax sp. TaxID=50421 RepID=UPI0017B5CA11|nr:phage tail protein [Rhodoferax sp.]NMM21842.1 phage tail protein [Rhodoferax sp.]
MPVVQQGSINTTALIVPDLYVQIVPPSVSLLNGVPSNILGVVGTATWGPTNSPVILGSMADYAYNFGTLQNRKYDMGTIIATAVMQGASNFRGVRVTDGTDVAATIVILTNCLTVTGKYTGTFGNGISVRLSAGSAATTQRAIVAVPGNAAEVFDNIGAGLTGNALWVAIAAAINNGNSPFRGPSNLIVATAGVGITAPDVASYPLTGGSDGVATITSTVLLGVDTGTRTGMYSLRNTGCSIAVLADCDTSSAWTTEVAYGYSEGTYMILVGPSGDTVSNAVTVKATAGIDAYIAKYLHGDWIYFNDTVNGVVRLVSPQGYIAGLMSNQSPEQSTLNKQLQGVVGTQRSYSNRVYSSAELQLLGQAGIDVITNPVPGGSYFGARFGHNTSSNPVTNGDNYTRMTNYLAYTFNAGMGKFVGRLQSSQPVDPLRAQCGATLAAFLEAMKGQRQIDDYSVQCDLGNNTPNRIALGYLQADVKVRYLSVVEKLLVNMEGGQSVQVSRLSTVSA